MKFNRLFWALALLSIKAVSARAGTGHKPLTASQSEARNESATPGFSKQIHDAQRITLFLSDALMLSNAQQHALQAYTVAHYQDLLLAATAENLVHARREYQESVGRVLAVSQFGTYVVLRQQLNGTAYALDGLELAAR